MSRVLSVRAALATAALAALAVMGVAAPAQAHDQLLSSTPAAGATVTEELHEIVLDYTAEIDPNGTEMVVLDASGTSRVEGNVVVDGATVTVPLAASLLNGEYTVKWRVVSSDGHPISGEFTFTLTAPAAEETAAEEPTAVAPAPAPTAEATPSAVETTVAAEAEQPGASPMPWIIGGVVGVLAATIVAVLMARRSRRS